MKADLKKIEDLLTQERAQLGETDHYKSDQEAALKNEEQLTQKAKVKLQAVKNTKEYMATQRELETTRKMAQEREDEVIKLLGAIEEFKKNISAHEGDVNVIREAVAKEEAAATAEMAGLQAQATQARRERAEIAAKVRPEV